MQKWEYKTLWVDAGKIIAEDNGPTPQNERIAVEKYINRLGESGWELAGVAGSDASIFCYLYFKRPKF
jgi:hypothetical protein